MHAFVSQPVSRRAVFGGVAGLSALSLATWAVGGQSASASTNLLLNPGFEEVSNGKPAHWTAFSPASEPQFSASQEHVRSGDWALRIDDPTTTGIGVRSNHVQVTAGQEYEASVHMYLLGGMFSIYLEYWNAAGTRVWAEFRQSSTLERWHYVDLRGTAPDDAVTATVLLYSPATRQGVGHFDDVSLEAVTSRPVERFGPASLTAAVRGATAIGNVMYFTSRYNVEGDNIRLGGIDMDTGELVHSHDLPMGTATGQRLATDGTHLYIGAAGSTHVWRYHPETRHLEAWAAVGPATTWVYSMIVDGDHLYIGTYPDCTIRRIRLDDATVETYGRVSTSLYAAGVAVDDDYVYGGSAAPGRLLRWPKEGGEPVDLTSHLSESPVGILAMLKAGDGRLYVNSGRYVISMLPDGSERVAREIPAEDRYADVITEAPDGTIYVQARLTSNVYRVTDDSLELVLSPLADVENVAITALADGRLAGASGLGQVWAGTPGGDADVWDAAVLGFGYPDEAQSMLAHDDGTVWVAGHYSLTIHDVDAGTSRRLHVNGEAKALAQDADGTVYAAMYPSATVLAIDPRSYEVTPLGAIGAGQMRTMTMRYDEARNQLLVGTSPTGGNHQGSLTFVDLDTGEFEVRRDYLVDQRVMGVAIEGDVAYIVGDTYGESTQGPILERAQLAAVDLGTRELLWIREPLEDWLSYEEVVALDGVLYLMSRRPNGQWVAYDVEADEIVDRGELGGYGGMVTTHDRVFTWNHWALQIRQLPTAAVPEHALLYGPVPNGWYNNPNFALTDDGRSTWGMWGTDLALIPLMDPALEPEEPAWEAGRVYDDGDRVRHEGKTYEAMWWTQDVPGTSVTGSWQEIATNPDGVAIWTASRVFTAGDVAEFDGQLWRANWWTRNQRPGDQWGPWEPHAA